MTTIVYKDGILAGDRQLNCNGQIFGEATKIFQNPCFAFAMCGESGTCEEFRKFMNGEIFNKETFLKDEAKSFVALVIR